MQTCTKCKDITHHTKNYGGGGSRGVYLLLSRVDSDINSKGVIRSEVTNWLRQCWRHVSKDTDAKFLDEFFISSALLCRTHVVGNAREDREASWGEVKNCRDRVGMEIYGVDPHIIIASGKQACSSLLGRSSKLPRITGTPESLFHIEIPGETVPVRYPVIYMPDVFTAIANGDYDDPNGKIQFISKTLTYVYDICKYLKGEDQ